jgi:hypothetical protein
MKPAMLLLPLLSVVCAVAQPPKPLERKVFGHTLRSSRTPAIQLTFDRQFKYAGGERFELYGIADAEIHVFVDADEQKHVRRMYWVQFEGFLPNNSHTYNYKSKKTVKFGPFEFLADTRPFGTPDNPDSDGGHVKRLLDTKGLEWPRNAVRVRLIHLPNPDRRNELMIIYVEDGKVAQVPPEDLVHFESNQRWPKIEEQLLGHAQRLMTARK